MFEQIIPKPLIYCLSARTQFPGAGGNGTYIWYFEINRQFSGECVSTGANRWKNREKISDCRPTFCWACLQHTLAAARIKERKNCRRVVDESKFRYAVNLHGKSSCAESAAFFTGKMFLGRLDSPWKSLIYIGPQSCVVSFEQAVSFAFICLLGCLVCAFVSFGLSTLHFGVFRLSSLCLREFWFSSWRLITSCSHHDSLRVFEQMERTGMYLCILVHLCDRSDSNCGNQTPPCIVNFYGASSGLCTRMFSNLHTKGPICVVEAKDRLACKMWCFKWIQTHVNFEMSVTNPIISWKPKAALHWKWLRGFECTECWRVL